MESPPSRINHTPNNNIPILLVSFIANLLESDGQRPSLNRNVILGRLREQKRERFATAGSVDTSADCSRRQFSGATTGGVAENSC